MNSKKRILSLLLSLLLLTPTFASCADSHSSQETQSPATAADETSAAVPEQEQTEETISDGLGNPDLGGYDFRILSCLFGGVESASRVIAEDYTGEPVNDALRDSTLAMEERFNIKLLSLSGGNEFATQTATQTSINAGDDAFDIVVSHDGLTFALAQQGLFYNMYDIEQFDFDKPWWPAGTVEALSLCNQLYCASSYLSYLGLHWTRAMVINKDIAETLNLAIPYDMVREGQWTLDAMLQLVENTSQDLDGNGKISTDDQIGFVTGGHTFYCLNESMQVSPYKHDENGAVYLDFDLEKVDTFINKWRTLMNSEDYMEGDPFGSEIFKLGQTLLNCTQIGDAYDIFRETDMRYGFLPAPKFDELQNNYVNCCTDLPWAIPKTISEEQGNVIGTVVEALSCQNYKSVLPVYFDMAMKSRTADSPDDAEMLQIIADTRTISFPYTFGLSYHNLLGELGKSRMEVSSYYARSHKMAEKTLERLIKKFEKMAEDAALAPEA